MRTWLDFHEANGTKILYRAILLTRVVLNKHFAFH